MDVSQFVGLGIVGTLILAALSLFSGKKPAQAIEQISAGIGGAAQDVADAFEYPLNQKLSEDQVFALAQDISRVYGGRVDSIELLTFAYIESTFRPWVERHEAKISDYSVGLMQTLVKTAQEMYGRGYKAYPYPTRENLKNPVISMYYGAAYIDWIKGAYPNKGLEWWVRAYNGGPGHNYNSMTTSYWNKWKASFQRYGGGTGTGLTFG